MNEKEKKDKNEDETLEIIKKIINNEKVQKIFHRASEVDKENQNQRLKKALQRG